VVRQATQLTQGEFMAINNRTNSSKHQVDGDLNLPMDQVSWNEAVAYCNDLSRQEGLTPAYSEAGEIDLTKNGYRLLTAAENEFVTRERTTTLLFYGNEFVPEGLLCSWSDGARNRDSAAGNSQGVTHDVGTLRPNSYGVCDMTRNIWMWCNDRHDTGSSNNYPATLSIDPTGPATGGQRIAKGGAFWNDGGHHEMSANHWQWGSNTRSEEIGFRICRTVLPSENLWFSNVITAPASQATVSGTVSCAVTIHRSGDIGVAGVQYRIDGADIGSEIQTPPYSMKWDTRTVANGSPVLSVVALDVAGILTSEFETVNVNN
jgi:formylglycine-generating enzyme